MISSQKGFLFWLNVPVAKNHTSQPLALHFRTTWWQGDICPWEVLRDPHPQADQPQGTLLPLGDTRDAIWKPVSEIRCHVVQSKVCPLCFLFLVTQTSKSV